MALKGNMMITVTDVTVKFGISYFQTGPIFLNRDTERPELSFQEAHLVEAQPFAIFAMLMEDLTSFDAQKSQRCITKKI